MLSPLVLAGAFSVATAVLIDLPFNFVNVVVLPLLLGIGVDSGIHLVHRHRRGEVGQGELLHSSTARAVFYAGLTTVVSFGSLAVSTHRGLASLGTLLTVGIVWVLVCNLILLPALLAARTEREARTR